LILENGCPILVQNGITELCVNAVCAANLASL
jgi:hypothetical protein